MTPNNGLTTLVVSVGRHRSLPSPRTLRLEGDRLLLVARRSEALAAAQAMLPGEHLSFAADIADETAAQRSSAFVKSQGVALRGAVFCAGMHKIRPLKSASAAHYTELFKANFLTVTNPLSVLLPNFETKASVVVVSSATISRGAAAARMFRQRALIGYACACCRTGSKIPCQLRPAGCRQDSRSGKILKILGAEGAARVARAAPLGVVGRKTSLRHRIPSVRRGGLDYRRGTRRRRRLFNQH